MLGLMNLNDKSVKIAGKTYSKTDSAWKKIKQANKQDKTKQNKTKQKQKQKQKTKQNKTKQNKKQNIRITTNKPCSIGSIFNSIELLYSVDIISVGFKAYYLDRLFLHIP